MIVVPSRPAPADTPSPRPGQGHPARENGFCLCKAPFLIEERPKLEACVRYGREPLARLLQDGQRFRDPSAPAERLAKMDFHVRAGAHARRLSQWLDGF